MAKKESGIVKILELGGKFLEYMVVHADNKVEKAKEKVLHYILLFGLLLFAIVFILIGAVKYASEIFNYSEGLIFFYVGCFMIVLLALVSLVKKL